MLVDERKCACFIDMNLFIVSAEYKGIYVLDITLGSICCYITQYLFLHLKMLLLHLKCCYSLNVKHGVVAIVTSGI